MARPAYAAVQTTDGSHPYIRHREITSGSTSVAGQFVVEAADDTVTLAAGDATSLYGVALETGVAGDTIPILVATTNTVFSCDIAAGAPLASADVGAHFNYNATGIDLAEVDAPALICHGSDPESPDLTTGRVLVSVTTTITAGVPGTVLAV